MFGMGLVAIRKILFLLRAPGDAVRRQVDGGEVLDNPSAPSGHLPLHKGGFKIVGAGFTPPEPKLSGFICEREVQNLPLRRKRKKTYFLTDSTYLRKRKMRKRTTWIL